MIELNFEKNYYDYLDIFCIFDYYLDISSDEIYMEIPLSYEDDTDKVVRIINKVLESIRKHENVIEAEYIGIDKFADSSINYKLKILCKPENKFAVRRLVNGAIKKELDKNGISIPYPQLTIHKGEWKC